jgi:hypothetical protein
VNATICRIEAESLDRGAVHPLHLPGVEHHLAGLGEQRQQLLLETGDAVDAELRWQLQMCCAGWRNYDSRISCWHGPPPGRAAG